MVPQPPVLLPNAPPVAAAAATVVPPPNPLTRTIDTAAQSFRQVSTPPPSSVAPDDSVTSSPVPPAAIGPLAGSLNVPDGDNAEDTASAEDTTDDNELTLERVAAITAALDSNPDEKPAILHQFDTQEGALRTASEHVHEAQMAALHRGDRSLLDHYDSAYVAQLEQQRGVITVDDYARLEVAIERDNLATALTELQLPAAAVLRIKRVWMRRLVNDMLLGKRVRESLKSARTGNG